MWKVGSEPQTGHGLRNVRCLAPVPVPLPVLSECSCSAPVPVWVGDARTSRLCVRVCMLLQTCICCVSLLMSSLRMHMLHM